MDGWLSLSDDRDDEDAIDQCGDLDKIMSTSNSDLGS